MAKRSDGWPLKFVPIIETNELCGEKFTELISELTLTFDFVDDQSFSLNSWDHTLGQSHKWKMPS